MISMNTNDSLVLAIRAMGHVPAFKNKKIIAGRRLITAPKCKKWMVEATNSIISQLKYLCQTDTEETSTVPWQQSAIALLPQDDNWKVIPMITVKVRMVRKGDEGAIITLTEL